MSCKIPDGARVRIDGWPMLSKLEDGQVYTVRHALPVYGRATYRFVRRRVAVVRHYCESVDPWLRPEGDPDGNKIVIIALPTTKVEP